MQDVNENLGSTANLYKSPSEDFEYLNFLGKGVYGKVFRVRKIHGKDKNKIYAVKSICKNFTVRKSRKRLTQALTELHILKSIKHPFLIELMYVFQERTKIHFVLEYLNGGNLYDFMEKQIFVLEAEASFYMKEIILAIEYLHSKNIIHRDLKPQNILLDSIGHIKLIDFGLSIDGIQDNQLTRAVVGTPAYMAPEIRTRRGYGKAVDWWALGIIFYRLVVGFRPFDSNDLEELKLMISKGNFEMPENLSLQAQDLIRQLLRVEPNGRLGTRGAHEIKNHAFFGDTLWNNVLQRLETPPFVPDVSNNMVDIETNTSDEILFNSAMEDAVNVKFNNLFKEFYFVRSELIDNP